MKSVAKQPLALSCLFLLAACGASPTEENRRSDDAAAVASPASPKTETVAMTRAQAEQTHRCRGLLSAAWAASTRLPADDMPAALRSITMAEVNEWNKKLGSIPPGTLTAEEDAALMTSSTRVLATAEALEKEAPAIQSCRDAGWNG